MSKTHTTCPYCGVGCGVIAEVDDNNLGNNSAVNISGDTSHPANYGRLCAKGQKLAETLIPDGRLRYPQINGQQESWSRASAYVASRFNEAIAEHGPDSVAFYLSGQLLTEDYYVANKLMKGFIGSANVDTNSRLCMSSAVVAHKRAFGSDTVPGCYEDFELADLVVLVGSNLAWCQPVLFQRMMAAKEKRPQMKLVVIDPRQSATSVAADLHLQLKPDSDLVLFHGLLSFLHQQGMVDAKALTEADLSQLTDYPASRVTAATGIDEATVSEFYQLFASTEKVVTGFSMGSNQSVNGSGNGNAIINCHLATGRIGKAGRGPFSITGQPNAMGGREVGGLATSLAGHVDFDDQTKTAQVAKLWDRHTIASQPGLTAVAMFEAMAAGKIKAVWILGTNPAVSLPDSTLVAKALATCPTVVVSDCVSGTDTQAYADVLLPAQGWGEKSGSVTNAERRISRQRGFVEPLAEAKPDWWAVCQVAKAMGFGEAFSYQSPAQIFAEHAQLSAINGGPFDISALAQLSEAQYQQLPALQWPQPAGQPLRLHNQRLLPELQQSICIKPAQRRISQGRFILNNGRSRDQWHTMTRTGLAASLGRHQPLPQLLIHPQDAADYGISNDDLVQLDGEAVWPVKLSSTQARHQLFAPIHWSHSNSSLGGVNRHVSRQKDDDSHQPAFKGARVDIYRIGVRLWGQILLPEGVTPPLAYTSFWAKQKVIDGVLWWFASDVSVANWKQCLALQLSDAELWIDQTSDELTTQLFRTDGRLIAGMQLAQSRAQLSGDGWYQVANKPANGALLTQLLGTQPSPVLCGCVGVTEAEVKQAIESGAEDIEAVQQACGAGGGCGVCKMEIGQRCQSAALSQNRIIAEQLR